MSLGWGIEGRRRRRVGWRSAAAPAALALLGFALAVPTLIGCSHSGPFSSPPAAGRSQPPSDQPVELRRLRAELDRAEAALRGSSRADAVSALASGRIQVERAAREATGRAGEIARARSKLAEADRQLKAGQFGAAVFFVYRAESIAADLLRELRSAKR